MAKLIKIIDETIGVKDMPKVVIEEKFSESFKVGPGAEPYIRQKPFWISHAKFLILKGHYLRNRLVFVAGAILGPTVGWGFSIIRKIIEDTNVEPGEWIVLAIGSVISGILYRICYKKTDPRKALLSNMERHFEENQEELCMDNKK